MTSARSPAGGKTDDEGWHHALLMSATPGAGARARYLKAETPSLAEACAAPYPADPFAIRSPARREASLA